VSEKCLCGKQLHTFPEKKTLLVCHSKKGQIAVFPHLLKNSCSTNVQGTGPRHWAQFTLVGLFSRFGIAANFSGGDPGAKKERNAFYESTLLFLYIFFFFFLFTFVFLFLFFYILLSSSFFFSYSFSSSLSSLSLFLSVSFSLSLPLSLVTPSIKQLEVQKITQSTC
jgi:ABC-type multidrug transport system fused ATPase/permease subunit